MSTSEFAAQLAAMQRQIHELGVMPRQRPIGFDQNDNFIAVTEYDNYSTFGEVMPAVTVRTGESFVVSWGAEWFDVGYASNFISNEVYLGVGIDGKLPDPFAGADLVVDLKVSGGTAAVVLNIMPVSRRALVSYLDPGEHTFQLYGYCVEVNAGQTFPPRLSDVWLMVEPVETY